MGIAFGGGGSQTVFGSSGAGNFLTRLTSITALIFMVTSLGLAHYSSQQDSRRLQKLAERQAIEKKAEADRAAKLKTDLEKSTQSKSPAPVAPGAGATGRRAGRRPAPPAETPPKSEAPAGSKPAGASKPSGEADVRRRDQGCAPASCQVRRDCRGHAWSRPRPGSASVRPKWIRKRTAPPPLRQPHQSRLRRRPSRRTAAPTNDPPLHESRGNRERFSRRRPAARASGRRARRAFARRSGGRPRAL